MRRSEEQLRDDAIAIWQAGVKAVSGSHVVERNIELESGSVRVGDEWIDLDSFDRILVVGAGKACASMVVGLEQALAPLADSKPISGWVNVPASTLRPTRWIHLHEARHTPINLPTPQALEGTLEILKGVEQADSRTWCIVLISGGGSALLPAPIDGLTLEDKIELTQALAARGANIVELNTVRRSISKVKGGGLLRSCRAGRLDTLVISDVLSDPRDAIASGPTVPSLTTRQEALSVLAKYLAGEPLIEKVQQSWGRSEPSSTPMARSPKGSYQILANLAEAIDAAGIEAEKRGYSHAMTGATKSEGDVKDVAKHWVRVTLGMLRGHGADCWISGGEPTVTLAPEEQRGRGGRNQQLVLEAWRLLRESMPGPIHDLVLLSGGTDGEDGPTTAAGAWLDGEIDARSRQLGIDLDRFAARNDGFTLFESVGSLLQTGPTDTNVCDLRVVVLNPGALSPES